MISHACDGDFTSIRITSRWMPAHGATHTIKVALDSRGKPISGIMWRANRLVDLAAKAAAEPNRVPRDFTAKIKATGQLVQHSTARLGVATYGANNYVTELTDDSGSVKKVVLRDSTAPPKARPRPKAPAAAVASDTTLGARAVALLATPAEASRSRKRSRAATATCSQPHKRSKLSTVARQEALQDEARTANWLRTRELTPATGPTAQARIEAIRLRLAPA